MTWRLRSRLRTPGFDLKRSAFTDNPTGADVTVTELKFIPTAYESIEDIIGRKGMVNHAIHSTVSAVNHSRPALHWPDGTSVTYSNWYDPLTSSGGPMSLLPVPSESELADLSDLAWNALYPQVPEEVSIPNFLYELREVGDMIPKLEENMVATVSGAYLTYEFGWAPFISDLSKLHRLSSTVSSRIRYLRDTWGKETRISFSTPWDPQNRASENTVSLFSTLSPVTFRRTSFSSVFRAGGYLFHRLERLYGLESTLRGMSAALGLTNPAGVAWEAIPWSFVVDWFGRVNNAIAREAFQPFPGTWDIRRVCWSLTSKMSWSSTYNFPQSGGGPSPSSFTPWDGDITYYRREPNLPISNLTLWSGELTPQQQMLAAALIGARAR